MSKLLSCAALLLLVSAPSVQAADVSLGLQGHFAIPTGKAADSSHMDGNTGYGLGLNLPVDFGDGHVLRPKVDYLSFSRTTMGVTAKSNTFSVLADYTFYFTRRRQGAYLIAGLGFNSTERELSASLSGMRVSISKTTSGLAYNLGAGFAFNKRISLELKYMGAEMPEYTYNGYTVDTSYTANAVVASVGVTF